MRSFIKPGIISCMANLFQSAALRLNRTRAHLIDVAPSLYRLALTAVLDLRFTETPPPTSDLQAYLAFRRRVSEFHDGQHMHERALLKP